MIAGEKLPSSSSLCPGHEPLPSSKRPVYSHSFLRPLGQLPNFDDILKAIDSATSSGGAAQREHESQVRLGPNTAIGSSSDAAIALYQAIKLHGGFVRVGDGGSLWVFRVPAPSSASPNWDALAIAGNCLIDPIFPQLREELASKLRHHYGQRHAYRGRDQRECNDNLFAVWDLLEQMRNWDRAPRLVPLLYRMAVTNKLGKFRVSKLTLAQTLFAGRRIPSIDWKQQVHAALGLLKFSVYKMRVPSSGAPPSVVGFEDAVRLHKSSDHDVELELTPEFVKFFEPCFEGDVLADVPTPNDSREAGTTTTGMGETMSNNNPEASTSAKTCNQSTSSELDQQDIAVIKEYLPAAHFATIAGRDLKHFVSSVAYRNFLQDVAANSQMPTDPVQRMILEQLVMAHCRIGQLQADAATATDPQEAIALTSAVVKLMSEFRKSTVVLRSQQSQSERETNAKVQNSPVPVADGPRPRKKRATKLRTKKESCNGQRTCANADHGPQEPDAAQSFKAARAAKAARFSLEDAAMATSN